jgi:hypothetical protein
MKDGLQHMVSVTWMAVGVVLEKPESSRLANRTSSCAKLKCIKVSSCNNRAWMAAGVVSIALAELKSLPIVLDCPYSKLVQQLVCYSSMFSVTETIISAMSMLTCVPSLKISVTNEQYHLCLGS